MKIGYIQIRYKQRNSFLCGNIDTFRIFTIVQGFRRPATRPRRRHELRGSGCSFAERRAFPPTRSAGPLAARDRPCPPADCAIGPHDKPQAGSACTRRATRAGSRGPGPRGARGHADCIRRPRTSGRLTGSPPHARPPGPPPGERARSSHFRTRVSRAPGGRWGSAGRLQRSEARAERGAARRAARPGRRAPQSAGARPARAHRGAGPRAVQAQGHPGAGGGGPNPARTPRPDLFFQAGDLGRARPAPAGAGRKRSRRVCAGVGFICCIGRRAGGAGGPRSARAGVRGPAGRSRRRRRPQPGPGAAAPAAQARVPHSP